MRLIRIAPIAVALALALSSNAAASTVVTIQFDDGNADAYAAGQLLADRGMHATFYVNSGAIGSAGHMSWTQLHDLVAAGNEIGGHTIDHKNLKTLSTAEARHQVCDDRTNLIDQGFDPASFAYPFGGYDAMVEGIVRDCGYSSARTVSGVDDRIIFAETIPPRDPYATRVPQLPKKSTPLSTIEGYVTAAEQHGGGWIQLVFHHLCSGCNTYSISAANFTALLDWLAPRASQGTVVETTAQVIGG